MRKFLTAALAALACVGGAAAVAAPAQAYTNAQYQKAWQTVTNDCLHYTGCASISACSITDGYYATWYFRYHTTYYGWVGRYATVRQDGVLWSYGQSSFCG